MDSKRFKRVKKSVNDVNPGGSSIELSNNTTNTANSGPQSAMPRDDSMTRRKRRKVETSAVLSTRVLTESGNVLESLDAADPGDGKIPLQSKLTRDDKLEVSDMEGRQDQVAASSKDDFSASKATTKTLSAPASSVTTCSEQSVTETESVEHNFCVWQSVLPPQPIKTNQNPIEELTHATSRDRKSKCSRSKLKVKTNGNPNEASSLKTDSEQKVGSDEMSKCSEISRGLADKKNAEASCVVSTQDNIQPSAQPVQVPKFNKRKRPPVRSNMDPESGDGRDNVLHTDSAEGDVTYAQNTNASSSCIR